MVTGRLILIFFVLIANSVNAQKNETDSLLAIINQQKRDTAEVNTLIYLANQLQSFDSTYKHIQAALLLSEKLNFKKGEANCLTVLAIIFSKQMNFSSSIKYALAALNIYEDLQNYEGIVSVQGILQSAYRNVGDYKNSLLHAFSAKQVAEVNGVRGTVTFPGQRLAVLFTAEIAQTYLLENQLDSALYYTRKVIDQNELFNGSAWNFPLYLLATIQNKQGDYNSALTNYRSAIPLASKNGFFHDTLQIFSGMSGLFQNMGELDSAIYYAEIVKQSRDDNREIKSLLDAVNTLKQSYKLKGIKDSALKYTELSYALKDSLFGKEKDREIQNFSFNERLKAQEIIAAQEKYKSKIQVYALVAGLLALLLIAAILWRNNLQKQNAKTKIEKAGKFRTKKINK